MNIQFAGRHLFKTIKGTAAALSPEDEELRNELMEKNKENAGWQQILNQEVRGKRVHVLLTDRGAPAARALITMRLGLHAGLATNPDQAKRDRHIMETMFTRLSDASVEALIRTLTRVWAIAKGQQPEDEQISTSPFTLEAPRSLREEDEQIMQRLFKSWPQVKKDAYTRTIRGIQEAAMESAKTEKK